MCKSGEGEAGADARPVPTNATEDLLLSALLATTQGTSVSELLTSIAES